MKIHLKLWEKVSHEISEPYPEVGKSESGVRRRVRIRTRTLNFKVHPYPYPYGNFSSFLTRTRLRTSQINTTRTPYQIPYPVPAPEICFFYAPRTRTLTRTLSVLF